MRDGAKRLERWCKHRIHDLTRAYEPQIAFARRRVATCGNAGLVDRALDDLLRRNEGPVGAEALREVFGALDRGCSVDREEAP